jgi:hypothetical protein
VQCADRGSTERDEWLISVQFVDRGSVGRDSEPIFFLFLTPLAIRILQFYKLREPMSVQFVDCECAGRDEGP